MATAVNTLRVPTGALREKAECQNHQTNKQPGKGPILPSRVATQEEPNGRQHETRKFPEDKNETFLDERIWCE